MEYKLTKEREDKTHIYYNARIAQGVTAGTTYRNNTLSNTLAFLIDQQSSNLLDEPNNYVMSILRFVCNLATLPIRIFDIVHSPPNITQSPFSIAMQYNGHATRKYIYWEPEDKTAPLPDITQSANEYFAPYFYMYTYAHLVKLINKAFYDCFNDLLALTALPTIQAPFIVYNRESRTFDLIVDDTYRNASTINSATTFNNIEIYYNTAFYNLLFNTNAQKVHDETEVLGRNYLLQIGVSGDNIIDQTSGTPIYYNPYDDLGITPIASKLFVIKQEYQILNNLADGQQIIFTSDNLQTVHEYSSPQIGFTGLPVESLQQNQLPIITDLDISEATNDNGSPRQIVTYTPTAEYRLINIRSTKPIRRIDIKIWWTNRYGYLIPLYLGYFNIATLKIVFIKK